jgi:S1-C subfamily serine protease
MPVEVYLTEVLPGGQAKEAGLPEGDVLASYDGRSISNDAELVMWLNKPGDTTRNLVVLRGHLRLTFAMKPGKLGVLMKGRIPQPQSELGSNALQR